MPIATVLTLIQGAMSVLTAFRGTAATAKITTTVTEAIGTISALTPLLQSFGNGNEVTPEDVRAALAGKDAALAAFDKAIADKS